MDDSSTPVVRVVCGPTAAGKTHAAMRFAEYADIAVISADSRQLYKSFDIGTAKPTPHERSVTPHFGIDVLEPGERASAAWWAASADGWMHDAIANHRTPVIVGGTGMYLRALFGVFFDEPPLDTESRRLLQDALGILPVVELRRWTEQLDPARAGLGRTQLLRALEVALLTGRRVSDLQRDHARPAKWRARYLLVDPGTSLGTHIEVRTRAMLAAGWPEEVQHLMEHVPGDAPAWNATGYRAIRALVQGELSIEEAVQTVVIQTRQYAKRQRTWFRHQLAGEHVTHINVRAPNAETELRAWWNGAIT